MRLCHTPWHQGTPFLSGHAQASEKPWLIMPPRPACPWPGSSPCIQTLSLSFSSLKAEYSAVCRCSLSTKLSRSSRIFSSKLCCWFTRSVTRLEDQQTGSIPRSLKEWSPPPTKTISPLTARCLPAPVSTPRSHPTTPHQCPICT